jgi:hypothetical protein
VIKLQVDGACYSWRLSPPKRLGGLWLHRSTQEDYAVLWRRIVRGTVLTLPVPRRATLVECVIELPLLWVGSCGAQHVGLVWCQLAAEPPQDKNYHVILVFPFGLHPCYTSLYLLSFRLYLYSCSCNLISLCSLLVTFLLV